MKSTCDICKKETNCSVTVKGTRCRDCYMEKKEKNMAIEDYEQHASHVNHMIDIAEGCICKKCFERLIGSYGEPILCEDCGGEGAVATYKNQHQGY